MIGILLVIGFFVLIGHFCKDVLAGADSIAGILGIIIGLYVFMWLLPLVIDGLISLIYNIIVG